MRLCGADRPCTCCARDFSTEAGQGGGARRVKKMAVRKEVFLSYGREPEVISFVTQLKHDLESRGFSVWLDTEDIPAGCDWHGAIGREVD